MGFESNNENPLDEDETPLASPDEKPDLIKGSFAGRNYRKMSVANMKNDSIVLNDNQARYKVLTTKQ